MSENALEKAGETAVAETQEGETAVAKRETVMSEGGVLTVLDQWAGQLAEGEAFREVVVEAYGDNAGIVCRRGVTTDGTDIKVDDSESRYAETLPAAYAGLDEKMNFGESDGTLVHHARYQYVQFVGLVVWALSGKGGRIKLCILNTCAANPTYTLEVSCPLFEATGKVYKEEVSGYEGIETLAAQFYDEYPEVRSTAIRIMQEATAEGIILRRFSNEGIETLSLSDVNALLLLDHAANNVGRSSWKDGGWLLSFGSDDAGQGVAIHIIAYDDEAGDYRPVEAIGADLSGAVENLKGKMDVWGLAVGAQQDDFSAPVYASRMGTTDTLFVKCIDALATWKANDAARGVEVGMVIGRFESGDGVRYSIKLTNGESVLAIETGKKLFNLLRKLADSDASLYDICVAVGVIQELSPEATVVAESVSSPLLDMFSAVRDREAAQKKANMDKLTAYLARKQAERLAMIASDESGELDLEVIEAELEGAVASKRGPFGAPPMPPALAMAMLKAVLGKGAFPFGW